MLYTNNQLKCISVKAPWAWAIAAGVKDVENRSWRTHYRGELGIHAGKTFTKYEHKEISTYCENNGLIIPDYNTLQSTFAGKVIAIVKVVDCIQNSRSMWAVPNCHHWVLEHLTPVGFVPLPAIGKQGFFRIEINK